MAPIIRVEALEELLRCPEPKNVIRLNRHRDAFFRVPAKPPLPVTDEKAPEAAQLDLVAPA
ncbi:hypothetical protein ABG193_15905 (plasmid) [Paracoccus marcusii]